MSLKKCTLCKQEKTLDQFYQNMHKGQLRYTSRCKECTIKESRKYREGNKKKISVSRKQYREKNHEKIIEKSRKDWDENKDKRNKSRRDARKKDPEKYSKSAIEWREKNRDKVRQYKKKYYQKYKVQELYRKRVRAEIKNKKKGKYTDILGCSYDFLKQWFEFNFKLDEYQNIDWDNQGAVWHIDHVLPCSKFDMNNPDDQKKCFHWKNLVPLLKEINMSKSNKIDRHYILRQELRLYIFEKSLKSN